MYGAICVGVDSCSATNHSVRKHGDFRDVILGKWLKGMYPETTLPQETSLLSHRSICKGICTSAVTMQQSACAALSA